MYTSRFIRRKPAKYLQRNTKAMFVCGTSNTKRFRMPFIWTIKNRGERKRERERARGNQFIRWSLFYVNFGTFIVHWLHQPHWKHWLVFGVYAINIETVSTPKCPSNVQILFSLCSSLNFASPSDWKETFANGVCTHICEIYVGILVVKNKNQIKVEWKRNHWHTKKAHARSPP